MYYIDSLMLKAFRNYKQQHLYFSPRLNILVGENGQGKTNLIEAIYYLTVTRSFRTNRDQELANWNDNSFLIKGVFVKNSFKDELQVKYRSGKPLNVKLNQESLNRFDHLQRYPVVVFSPDDLMLIREGPSIRRRFLNLEGSRLSPVYFSALRSYQKVLQQRNRLLKESFNNRLMMKQLIEPWNDSLVSIGSSIIQTRVKIIKELENEAKNFFKQMTRANETLTLEYDCEFEYSTEQKETMKNFLEVLLSRNEIELRRGSTQVGPHLDDLKILINGYDTRKYSSQGQKRTAALALKMAEVSLFKKMHEDWPIILLDDVFSELDQNRKQYFLNYIRANTGQCFITTATDRNEIINNLEVEHKIFSVCRGSVNNENSGSGH